MTVYYCKELRVIEKKKIPSVPGIRAAHGYEAKAVEADDVEKIGDSFFGDIVLIERPKLEEDNDDNARRTEKKDN